jgi:DNA-directed RNA polymerase specialized sigma24 family protein
LSALSDFEELGEGALAQRSDEGLVAYVVAARGAGRMESARLATGILTYRLLPLIEARVAAKIPRDSCEDVVMETLESFVRSAFDGKVIRSAKAFIATIAQRRIADFHRARERDPDQLPFAGEHVGDENIYGPEEWVDDETGVVAFKDAVERVLATRKELHQQVILLYGPEQIDGAHLPAKEVVARMQADHGETVSEANVQKIWQRFKEDLEKELSAGEDVEASDE